MVLIISPNSRFGMHVPAGLPGKLWRYVDNRQRLGGTFIIQNLIPVCYLISIRLVLDWPPS